MAQYELPEFVPDLRIIARGSDRLMVTFDTATDLDLRRSPRIVMVDMSGVTNISTGLQDIEVVDAVDKQLVTGRINLLTSRPQHEPETYLLADIELHLHAQGRPGKDGKFSFPPASDIEQMILQGVADAFADASLAYGESADATAIAPPPAERPSAWPRAATPAYAGVGAVRQGPGRSTGKTAWKTYLFAGAAALLLLAAAAKIMSAPSDPLQSAVNKALASDPKARDEQIEITRQTLREMGLDPGKNGDLGCLAAQ